MWSALESELTDWYDALPGPIRFDRDIDLEVFPPPEIDGNIAWLRSTYVTCPGVFAWPAAQEAASSQSQILSPEYVDGVGKLYKTVLDYTYSAYQMVDGRFNPQVWTHVQGLYIAGLCAAVLLESPNTAPLAPPGLLQAVNRIIDILKTYAPYNSSIEGSHQRLRQKIEDVKRRLIWGA